MEPSTSLDVSLPTYEQARIHSLSTLSVLSAPPEEPNTSPEFTFPIFGQARVHSLSRISARVEATDAPPQYEEIDTTISRRTIRISFPEPSAIIEQPAPIPYASSCHVPCSHSDNQDLYRNYETKEDKTMKLCILLCILCLIGICALVILASSEYV